MFPFVVLPAAVFVGGAIGRLAAKVSNKKEKEIRSDLNVKEPTKAIYFTDRQQLERVFKKLILIKQTQERHKREERMLIRSFHLVCNETELF